MSQPDLNEDTEMVLSLEGRCRLRVLSVENLLVDGKSKKKLPQDDVMWSLASS